MPFSCLGIFRTFENSHPPVRRVHVWGRERGNEVCLRQDRDELEQEERKRPFYLCPFGRRRLNRDLKELLESLFLGLV